LKTSEVAEAGVPHDEVQTTIDRYSDRFDNNKSNVGERVKDTAELSTEYYNLSTDFYLSGWGKMFHFGVRKKGESLRDSLVRYEIYLADKLQLREGEKCLDLGAGVGGPMMNIAKHTKATITGININSYQIEKGEKFVHEEGLEKYCSFLECNWMKMPFPDQSFDKAYGIEATCHAADKRTELFTEVNRLLKPGSLFALYEWVMTEKYNPADPEQQNIKRNIEIGDGISNLNTIEDVKKALADSGFELLECRNRAYECDKETPWYLAFKGKGFSLQELGTSPVGRVVVRNMLRFLETIRIVPKGSTKVHEVLELAADGLAKGGERDIFTPMMFYLARKK